MSNLPIDPNLLPLLDGIRPYLGTKARNYSDMLSSMVKLLTSNSGREVITTMSRMLTPAPNVTAEAVQAAPIPGPNMAFSLFLILVLLLFASGGMGWPVAVSELFSDTCPRDDGEVPAAEAEV